MNNKSAIILLGIKHCGKTTLGKELAKALCYKFYDCDDEFTHLVGKTPRAVYTESGKIEFIKKESFVCSSLALKVEEPCIIATGGGICDNKTALSALKKIGYLVFLDTLESNALMRIIKEATPNKTGGYAGLPAYIAKDKPKSIQEIKTLFHAFYTKRTEEYRRIADIIVSINGSDIKENTLTLMNAVKDILRDNDLSIIQES